MRKSDRWVLHHRSIHTLIWLDIRDVIIFLSTDDCRVGPGFEAYFNKNRHTHAIVEVSGITETIWLRCLQRQTANTSSSDSGATWINWLFLGSELPRIINIWIMSVDKDFLTWLLISWRLICQQIRSQIWGTNVNNRRLSIKYCWKGTWNRERPIWNIRNHIMFHFLFNTRNRTLLQIRFIPS